jgi:Lar family restriction alleviation protein
MDQKTEVKGNRLEVLKTCPFCGEKEPTLHTAMGESWVSCQTCGASSNMKRGETEARAAWNMRIDERTEFAEIILRLKQRGVITDADAERAMAWEVAHG